MVSFHRDEIQNWKYVLKRLYENDIEFTSFFYSAGGNGDGIKHPYSGSSLIGSTETSDISFYYSNFKQNFPRDAIRIFSFHRDEIQNWKYVLKRLYENDIEFTSFFYSAGRNGDGIKHPYSGNLTDCETDKVGYELGRAFAK
ncbi:hypothetical protein MP638_004022, partial [Amoeboaphelidium occidentale]